MGHEITKARKLGRMLFRGFAFSWLFLATMSAQSTSGPRTIDKGDHSYIGSPRQVVIRTPEEWTALWNEHAAERPRPAVDFSKEMVVGVFLGSRPTAAYSVAIVDTLAKDDALLIRYRATEPRRGAITAQVITFPYHLAVVPKSAAKDVKFEKIP
jgi:protease stability complex PrcB-like protein